MKDGKINLCSKPWGEEELISLITFFNCINFSFWAGKGEEKWSVKIGGQAFDGAIGLFQLLEEKILSGTPLLEAKFLLNLKKDHLSQILKGNVQIPMLEERLKCLNGAGKVLLKRFGGKFVNILKEADKSAVKFVNLLIKNFPSFDDFALIDGIK